MIEMEEKKGKAREYYFRAKQTSNNEWVFGSLCETAIGDGYYIYKAFADKKYSIKQGTIGQYIGLKDKNNNDIFEGDIIQAGIFNAHNVKQLFKVIFNHGGFYLDSGGTHMFSTYHIGGQNCEVVGNIYDNPELLGGG